MNLYLPHKPYTSRCFSFALVLCASCILSLHGCASSMQGHNVTNGYTARAALRTVPGMRLAVVGFDVATSTYGLTMVGKKAEEMLTTALAKTRQFNMINRSRISQVLDEQKLQISGMVDAATAVQIGKLLGAQVIITGSITEMGCSAVSIIAQIASCRASIDVQVINVETAEIITAETGTGKSSAIIHYDANKGIASRDAELWVSEALRSAADDVAIKISIITR